MTAFEWIIAADVTLGVIALCAWVNAWIDWLGKDLKKDG